MELNVEEVCFFCFQIFHHQLYLFYVIEFEKKKFPPHLARAHLSGSIRSKIYNKYAVCVLIYRSRVASLSEK